MIGYYARVSTEEQAKKGSSIEDQLRAAKMYLRTQSEWQSVVEENQQELEKEYIDRGVSGETTNRPALMQLRQDAADGKLQLVICFDPDRLSRKLMHQLYLTEELDNLGVELLFVNGNYQKTPEGNLFYSLRGAVSEFEKAKIVERMKRGRLTRLRQGKVLRDYNIYGYDYNKTTRSLEINQQEAKIVKKIFSLFIQPTEKIQGINGIANYLTDKGIPTKTGKKVWHRQVVKQILQNPTYTGVFYQHKWQVEKLANINLDGDTVGKHFSYRSPDQWIPVECPNIIDEKTFLLVQELLSNARRKWNTNTRRSYLLSGLLICGECGNTCTGRRVKNWGRYEFVYTDKKNNSGQFRGCGLNIKCEQLDKVVLNWLFDKVINENNLTRIVINKLDDYISSIETELQNLRTELQNISKQRENIINLLEKQLLTNQDAEKYMRELQLKEECLKSDYECSKSKLTAIKSIQKDSSENEIKHFFKLANNWDYTARIEETKRLVRSVIKEIKVFQNTIKILTI